MRPGQEDPASLCAGREPLGRQESSRRQKAPPTVSEDGPHAQGLLWRSLLHGDEGSLQWPLGDVLC